MGVSLKLRFAGAVLSLFAASLALPAQDSKTMIVEPPAPLLTGHFMNWDRQGDAASGKEPAAADAANAAILKEDGLTRFATATYTHSADSPEKSGTLDATAMQFVDATGAFSAFTFYRSQLPHAHAMTGAAKIGSESVSDGDTTLMWAGTAILRTKGTANAKELLALTSSLPKVSGSKGLSPLLPSYVPAKGLVAGSVRYALGPVGYKQMGGFLPPDMLAWDKSAEVLTADYTGRSGKGVLTLLIYPTPQIAGDRGRAIEAYMNSPEVAKSESHALKMRRIGTLIGVATGGFSPEQAKELIEGLHTNQVLTFDKKMPLEFHAEMVKTYTLMQNIAWFSAVVGGAAVLLGLFLGGARAGWRVMRGKPAASEPEFLTINLREKPKGVLLPDAAVGDGKAT
ncbi:hypothetical protein SAMN05421770_10756 [Granulicella rosea]|uniref:Uncharacterized protein n=1 Tax=Granulicella rosea TaxID=474952 RepID=A0A239LK50_9BACT|nr:DUF6599 family protein [Granulicella rosea]SNT30272.1 hypothetical protein SAMN05421770_10756 [Granulicella rosea]